MQPRTTRDLAGVQGRVAACSARSTLAAAMTAPTGFPKAPIGMTVAACAGAIGVIPF